jgi:hypothetical protein
MRKRRRFRLEQRRQEVAFQVMNPQCGHFPGVGEAPGQGCTGQKGADQAGTRCISDSVQVLGLGVCLCHDAADQG